MSDSHALFPSNHIPVNAKLNTIESFNSSATVLLTIQRLTFILITLRHCHDVAVLNAPKINVMAQKLNSPKF